MATRFTVIEHANPALFDVGAQGDSIGDARVFSNDLYDEVNSNVVGTDQDFCFRSVVGKRFECAWSNIFNNGTIITQGPAMTVAITGGTGDYVGASGELTITMLEGADHQFTFTFELA